MPGIDNLFAGSAPQAQPVQNVADIAQSFTNQNVMNQARQAQTASTMQDAMNKQRQYQISMLNGVLALPEEQQQDALSRIVPMMNRMGPVQFDEGMTPSTAKLYLMSNVPTEQVPMFGLNQQMANTARMVQERLAGGATQNQPAAPAPGAPSSSAPLQPGTPMPQNGIINNVAPIPTGGGQVIDPQTLALMATLPGYDKAAQTINEIQNQSPQGQANIAAAKKQGENTAENIQGANVATQTLGSIEQNLDALDKLNNSLPGPEYLPAGWKAEGIKRLPATNPLTGKAIDKTASNAYEQFQEINQQQVLNGLSELVKSGAIRGNQFVEKILARGYAINPDATPEARKAEIDNLRAELKNITARQQNVAGANQPYQPIPVNTGQSQNQQGNTAPEGTIIHDGKGNAMVKRDGQWVKM